MNLNEKYLLYNAFKNRQFTTIFSLITIILVTIIDFILNFDMFISIILFLVVISFISLLITCYYDYKKEMKLIELRKKSHEKNN